MIFRDMVINIIATILPLVVLQFVSLPLVANQVGSEEYGDILFYVSVFTIISFPLGNVLNNTRLLLNKEYVRKGIDGDFNIILSFFIVIAVISFTIMKYVFFKTITNVELILLLIIIILFILREYFIVIFRLNLSFNKILINNILLGTGYLVGTIIYTNLGYWQYIYLTGLLSSTIYIFTNINFHKETFSRTVLFPLTLKNSLFLYSANLLKNIINQADKILLFPLLGPTNVSIYYASAIIGKMISMIVSPINTVMLSYLVKQEEKSDLKKNVVIVLFISSLCYFIILFFGPYILKILYPKWAEESSSLLKITTATAIITLLSSLLHPYNLRFNKVKWQLYINSTYLIIYIIFTFVFTSKFSLLGFSVAVLLAALTNLLFQIVVYFIGDRQNNIIESKT